MSDTVISPKILNDALRTNPPTANVHISTGTSDFLWMVFSVMGLADLIVLALTFARPGRSIFRQLAIIILTTSAIAYFSMASDLGHTPILTEWDRRGEVGPVTRDVWYVRYIQWFINAPLLVLLIFIGTGFPLFEAFSTLFLIDAVVVLGLVGALVQSTYKWGYFTMGTVALFYVIGRLLRNASVSTAASAAGTPSGTRSGFIVSAGYLTFLWLQYPLVWALTEGSNVIKPTGEMVWFGILDLLSGPFFLAYFLWSHHDLEDAAAAPRQAKAAEAGVVA